MCEPMPVLVRARCFCVHWVSRAVKILASGSHTQHDAEINYHLVTVYFYSQILSCTIKMFVKLYEA
jgi:hypothetical protein